LLASFGLLLLRTCFCSFDHDGLGRYGDPLSPDADLLDMDEVRCFYLAGLQATAAEAQPAPRMDGGASPPLDAAAVAADGSVRQTPESGDSAEFASIRVPATPAPVFSDASPRLVLSLPVGPDVVVWNMHRRYGPVRLPLMLEGYTLVQTAGWDDVRLRQERAHFGPSYEPVWVLRPQRPTAEVCARVQESYCSEPFELRSG